MPPRSVWLTAGVYQASCSRLLRADEAACRAAAEHLAGLDLPAASGARSWIGEYRSKERGIRDLLSRRR